MRSNKIHGFGTYDYSKVNYIDMKTKVCIICHNHDEPYEFWQTPSSHLRGDGCVLCGYKHQSEKRKLTIREFIEKANEKHGFGTYDYSESKYIDSQTPIKIICPKHGAFWQRPANHLQGNGCPYCKETLGENKIRVFLMKNNITFEKEKTFDDCRNIRPLRFDFYLPLYNLCIEFDGSCHFKKTNWNGEYTEEQLKENLESYQHRDQIKNDYCKSHNITLLRFNNLKTVEEELTNFFSNTKSIKQFDL